MEKCLSRFLILVACGWRRLKKGWFENKKNTIGLEGREEAPKP